MPYNRFYCHEPLLPHTHVVLSEDEAAHAFVCRIRRDDAVELIDGCGALARATCIAQEKKRYVFAIADVIREAAPDTCMTIALAYLKPGHLEFALEKCCEIGVDQFCLFPAEQSARDSLSPNALQRLQQVLRAATKQCGRLFLPKLHCADSLASAISSAQGSLYFGECTAPSVSPPQAPSTATFFIGPESGFTESEKEQLHASDVYPYRLARYTLRAETAAIVAAVHLCEEW